MTSSCDVWPGIIISIYLPPKWPGRGYVHFLRFKIPVICLYLFLKMFFKILWNKIFMILWKQIIIIKNIFLNMVSYDKVGFSLLATRMPSMNKNIINFDLLGWKTTLLLPIASYLVWFGMVRSGLVWL